MPDIDSLPRRRTLHLSIQHIGQETLLYDEQTHKAFCLNAVASAVWSRCDGETTPAAIASAAAIALGLPVTEELVCLALSDLMRDGLLEPTPVSHFETALPLSVSRRDMMIKLGVRAAILLPVIAAIVAPTAAQAYTGCVNC